MSPHRALRQIAVGITLCSAALAGNAFAGRNDLKLVSLCPQAATQECSWVQRGADGAVTGVKIDAEGMSHFRSLMSELGVVMGPRIPMPAGTLGYAGFLVSGELGITQISRSQPYWNGVNAVAPQTPNLSRPDPVLTTMGVFLRKGIWLPVPALELGGGVVNLLESRMLSWQAYAKLALHEGLHNLPIPSLAVRGAFAYVSGTDQANLRTVSVDVLVSKGFGLFKTARVEPFGGWSLLLIKASGKTIDFTPLVDTDLLANAAFPSQEVITRHRVFGGAKLKFGILAVIAQYELYLAGHSRDSSAVPAVDRSGQQSAGSLSLGLEF
jgi:hypothetical protein